MPNKRVIVKRSAMAMPPDHVIVILKSSPKRKGSRAEAQFKLFKDGMTVQTYLALEGQTPSLDNRKGWARRELRWAAKKNYIRIEAQV